MQTDVRIDAFVEDLAHEQLIGSIIRRLAKEHALSISLAFLSAKGGHPRVLSELALFRRTIDTGGRRRPDIVVVAIDANCKGWNQARHEIIQQIGDGVAADIIVACPDPHIERWFMADPNSFLGVVGHQPSVGRRKCRRDYYKGLLAEAVRKGGSPPLLGGIEYAPDLVEAMDFYRAGQNDRGLGHFLRELRACLVRRAQRNN